MYNASSYIDRCLNSLYHQDLEEEEFEVIIIDDGSTDDSINLVEMFRESHANIHLYREKNIGAYATRNKLLQHAKGAYIYCLDADDYLAYNSLRKILDFAVDTKLELICFDTEVTTSKDLFLVKEVIPDHFKLIVQNGPDFIRQNPDHRMEIWWYLIRKDYLKQLGLSFDDNQYNADVIFTIKLLLNATRLAYVPYSIHRYYQSPDSIMRSNNPFKQKRLLVALLNMLKDLRYYIDGLKSNPDVDAENIKNLENRMNRFAAFYVGKLFSWKISAKCIREKILILEKMDLYPLKAFIGEENSIKYRLFNALINNQQTVYPYARIKQAFRYFF